VRVTDRCAGTKGRILDLSEAAGQQIGLRKCGMTQVEIEVVPPFTTVPEPLALGDLPRSRRSGKKVAASTGVARKKTRRLGVVKGSRHKVAASSGKVRLDVISSAGSAK
jgi:rare lipoprotein A (peptidoglycan hydrolase)